MKGNLLFLVWSVSPMISFSSAIKIGSICSGEVGSVETSLAKPSPISLPSIESPHSCEGDCKGVPDKHSPVETQLGILFWYLKGFIDQSGLLVSKFEAQEHIVKRQILQIQDTARIHKPLKCGALVQMAHIENMLDTMMEAVELTKVYVPETNNMTYLIYHVIQLNVQLLGLFNSTGMPDPSVPGYVKTVYRSHLQLDTWQLAFRQLSQHPRRSKLVFRRYFTRAKDTLTVLRAHIGYSSVPGAKDNTVIGFFATGRAHTQGKNAIFGFFYVILGTTRWLFSWHSTFLGIWRQEYVRQHDGVKID
ncbi:hypothetical protein JCM33374_g3247 [Metschnikowia sp. JCM 33374]|nr:hypothetical protein JCM33374_g3247 [Metschnikowia sp. JCM 33374]